MFFDLKRPSIFRSKGQYMTSKIKICIQSWRHFWHLRGSLLALLGFEKVVFWTFKKLFWSCLGRVWVLFLVLKGPLLFAYLALAYSLWYPYWFSPLGSCGSPTKLRQGFPRANSYFLKLDHKREAKHITEWIPCVGL